MTPSSEHPQWLSQAFKELEEAKALRSSGCAYEAITYRCHQALEKAFIGYVLERTGERIESHDLVFLGRNAARGIPELLEHLEALRVVNLQYVEMTYPDDMIYTVSAEIVAECLRITEEQLTMLSENVKGA